MSRVSNLTLLYSALLLIAIIVLAQVGDVSNEVLEIPVFVVFVLLFCVITFLIVRHTERSIRNTNSLWLRTFSNKLSIIITNSVVILWSCAVVLIVVVISVAIGSTKVSLILASLLIGAVGYGRYLKKRFFPNSFLMYGISFSCALIITLLVIDAFPLRKL